MGWRLFGFVLLVFLVSFMRAEAAICETRSQLFKGVCFRNDNCASICEKEGFLTGRCKGFLLRCTCAKECGAGAGAGAGAPNGGDAGGGGDGGPSDDRLTSGSNTTSVYKFHRNKTGPGNNVEM